MSRFYPLSHDADLLAIEEQLFTWMVDIRRHIHQYPELSFREQRTADFIQAKLAEIGLDSEGGLGGTGVVCTLGEIAGDQPCVALRADMDALPITERTGVVYASKRPGIMHACGHDGHVAMLLGAAALLNRHPLLPGKIVLIFQPAEEHGNGASHLIDEGVVDGVGAVFGGHIDTHYRTGQITVDQGLICAFSDPFTVTITGRGGHAARPHEAADAVVAASNLVMAVQTLISREVDPNKAEVITIGCLQAGTAPNVIAGEALLRGTIRSTDEKTRLRTLDGLRRIVDSIASMHGVTAELVFEEGLPAVINSRSAAEVARAAAWRVTSIDNVISQGSPSLGGEDFAFYQQVTRGCLVRFGGALDEDVGPAHSGTFNFDEQCLRYGAHWLAAVALEWLRLTEPVTEIS
ncbi:MAG: amidohydrolase [Desulfocapsaceae bacterium]|nr:amidohydrolase [Desulfocapsaceae bacterium]